MTEPFIGQIEIYGFNFPPRGWAFAAGQLIPIQQNTALFSLIGTIYGGNGTTNFQLPNLASLQACGSGSGPGLTPRTLGEVFGSYSVTLTVSEIPAHNHGMNTCTGSPNPTDVPSSNSCMGAFQPSTMIYATPGQPALMHPIMVEPFGGNAPHNNVQPYLGLNFSIALQGVFPAFS